MVTAQHVFMALKTKPKQTKTTPTQTKIQLFTNTARYKLLEDKLFKSQTS